MFLKMRMGISFSLLLLPCFAFSGAPELVMQENVRLTATTEAGTIGVVSGQRFDRTYEWNDCALKSAMGERGYRWYGKKGIYDAAASLGLFDWIVACKGISRTVVEEAQLHFSSSKGAERWIATRRKLQGYQTVWSNDGLFVQWSVSPGRNQIGVDVYQICVAGKRPLQLAESQDDAINVTSLSGSGTTRYECLAVPEEAMLDVPPKR